MEPIGATASIFTLLNAAGSTCKFIYTLVLNIKDAPRDIRKQNEKLNCLYQTITLLANMHAKLPVEHKGVPWHEWAASFADEIAHIKCQIERRSIAVDRGIHGSHLFESFRWLLFDRQLKKFFESLDHWNIIFTQAIAAEQLEIYSKIDHKLDHHTTEIATILQHVRLDTNKTLHPALGVERYCTDIDKLSPWSNKAITSAPMEINNESLVSQAQMARMLRIQASTIEPIGIKVTHVAWYDTGSLKIEFGPTIARNALKNGRERRHTMSNSLGCTVSFQVPFWSSRRLSFVFFAFSLSSPLAGLNMRFSLKIPRIILPKSLWYCAAERGDVPVLRRCLMSGEVEISDVTRQGDTLLHIAARRSQLEVVSFLLDIGADPNATNDWGENPLHLSIGQAQNHGCTQKLLSAGADLFTADIAGRTPLHTFYNPVVEHLLQNCQDDIDLGEQDSLGMTIMHYACWSKCSTVDLVQSFDRSQQVPFTASQAYDIDIKDGRGRSILHLAAQRGNIPLMIYLLSHPSAYSLREPDYLNRTLLSYAVESRRVNAIDILLDSCVDVFARDNLGMTAIHHAVRIGNLAAVKRLITLWGTDQLNSVDCKGMTALDAAYFYFQRDIIEYLTPLSGPQYRGPCKQILIKNDKPHIPFAIQVWLWREVKLPLYIAAVMTLIIVTCIVMQSMDFVAT